MKTVLFCIHKKSPFYKVIPNALKNLGYNVEVFDYYQPDLTIRISGFVNNFIKLDPNRNIINRKINESLLARVKGVKPDYLLMIKGLHIDNKTIERIKLQNVKTINWFQDLLEFMPWLKKHAKVYDYLFTPDPLMQRELKRYDINSYFLPLASQPDDTLHNHNKIYEVVFSGQHTKRRELLFKKLALLKDKFVIWGYPKWKDSSLSKHYRGFIPTVDDMLLKFRQSKIVVNVQTAEDKYPSEVVSLRAFETTGVGTFLLNWKHKGINEFWKNGTEIVNFSTADELYKKADFFLKNNNLREEIAKRGWKRTKKDHTWTKRLKSMFFIIE